VTAEALPTALSLQWTYRAQHPPRPAWPEPGREAHRLAFDYAFEAVVAKGVVFFGSSADHKVYALDLATGAERWSFFTGGPVRFAPAVENGRVVVASDDGCVYCLSAADGALLWQFAAGPRRDLIFGNEQLISRWPLRSGVAVANGVVYLSAGVWPSEGVYLYALNAENGAVLWKSLENATRYEKLPHPPSAAFLSVAPQGSILGHKGQFFLPTGRNVPAAFDRDTGKMQYYHSAPDNWGQRWGGTWFFLYDGLLIGWRNHFTPDADVMVGEGEPTAEDGLVAFDTATGKRRQELPGKFRAVIDQHVLYASGLGKIDAYDVDAWLATGALTKKWEADEGRTYAMVKAGPVLITGGRGTITARNAADGQTLWEGKTAGQVRSLAVADGRLLASTTAGEILCYGGTAVATPPLQTRQKDAAALDAAPTAAAAKAQAKGIIADTAMTAGYCLLLGSGDGQLLYQLVRESNLTVFCVEPEVAKAAATRRALDTAGLYGPRVVVQVGEVAALGYPEYFADLIVVDRETIDTTPAGALYRLLRPCGGCLYVALPPGAKPGGPEAGAVAAWLGRGGVPATEIRPGERDMRVVRGKLEGSDDWSHQFGSAARTGSSNDQLVKWPLRVLWFGEPGPATIVSRHWQGPAPLCVNGRLFVTGQKHVSAVDAYNGRLLWQREFPSAGRWSIPGKGSNVAASADSLFLAAGNGCARLSAVTGETTLTYALPAVPELPADLAAKLTTWAFLAVGQEQVFGSAGTSESAGVCLFALRQDTGAAQWSYVTVGDIPNNGVSVGPEALYLIERTSTEDAAAAKRRGRTVASGKVLTALELKSGKVLWTTTEGIGDRTTLWLAQGVLVAQGGEGLTGYDAGSGRVLYDRSAKVSGSPVIVRDTIYIRPLAFDLRTGEPRLRDNPLTEGQSPWNFTRSYGCGSMGGSPNLLAFRSASLGLYGLDGDTGVHNFAGVRAGCYINAIPANGLLLTSPGDAGCSCSYSFQTTLALAPSTAQENWGMFYESLPTARVDHVSLNLGAPGDRRDDAGTLWLATPRPETPTNRPAFATPFRFTCAAGFGPYYQSTDLVSIEGTDKPWVYASGLRGIRQAELDLEILDRGFVAWPAAKPPETDGALTEPCWDGYRALAIPAEDAMVTFRYDDTNLYLAYERRPAKDEAGNIRPWRQSVTAPDGAIWDDDAFELFLSEPPPAKEVPVTTCLHLGVSASGARYDARWNYVSPYGARDLPELAVTIDGKADDWADKGLRVISLPGAKGVMRAPEDLDPCFRLGWCKDGLLLLAEIRDSVVYENPDPAQLYAGDALEFFMTTQVGSTEAFQVIVAPGATDTQAKPRYRFYDWRKATRGAALAMDVASAKTAGGYLVEAMLPWKNLKIQPAAGLEFGLQVFVDDHDKDKRPQFLALWHPAGHTERNPLAYQAFRLAAQPGAPIEFKRSAKPGPDGLYTALAPHPFPLVTSPLGAEPEKAAYQATWKSAVQVNASAFCAELAIPWQTLADAGLDRKRVMLDVVARGPLKTAPVSGAPYESLILVPKSFEAPRRLTVRLHFAELDDVKPGQRVFDVKLQGQTVLEDFDIVAVAPGSRRPVVKDFPGLTVARAVRLELVPKAPTPGPDSEPILSGIEILPP
jgi:outer membrane protein assembly factor BamB